MSQDQKNKSVIFYDGLCIVCSREIDHYRKQTGSDKFIFLDITEASFDAASHGVDPFKVHKVMHVKDNNGRLYTGAEAFRAIWKELPKYQFLYRWTDNALVKSLMAIGYAGFATIRPYLPRKKANCETSPYCDQTPPKDS